MQPGPEGQPGTPGSNGQGMNPAPGNQAGVGQEGAVSMANQQASGGATVPPAVNP